MVSHPTYSGNSRQCAFHIANRSHFSMKYDQPESSFKHALTRTRQDWQRFFCCLKVSRIMFLSILYSSVKMSSKKGAHLKSRDFIYFLTANRFEHQKVALAKWTFFKKDRKSHSPRVGINPQWDSSNTPIITCDKLRCIGLIANVWWPLPAGSCCLATRYLQLIVQLLLNDSCEMASQCQARMLRQASVPECLEVHVMGIAVGIILHRLSECIWDVREPRDSVETLCCS